MQLLTKLLWPENVLINSRERSSLVETSHQNLAKKIDTKIKVWLTVQPHTGVKTLSTHNSFSTRG